MSCFYPVCVNLKRWLSPYLIEDLAQIVLDYQGLLNEFPFSS
jgi:hypothetical protein